MTSASIYRFWFGVPATEANRLLMSCACVATCVEGLSDGDRLALIAQSVTLDRLKTTYPTLASDIDDQARGFQSRWSVDGQTLTHYFGDTSLSDLQWKRIQKVLVRAPSGFRYALLTTVDDALRETNVLALTDLVGTRQLPRELLTLAGFRPFNQGAYTP